MGLRDKYNAPAPTPVAAPSIADVAAPAGSRDLAALRARLAGSNGGVNPPEAVAAVTEDLLAPTTRETADGGAELIADAPTPVPSSFVEGNISATSAAPTKRKRRTKAEMEAERAVQAISLNELDQIVANAKANIASSVAVSETTAAVPEYRGILDSSIEELLREVLRRLQ